MGRSVTFGERRWESQLESLTHPLTQMVLTSSLTQMVLTSMLTRVVRTSIPLVVAH